MPGPHEAVKHLVEKHLEVLPGSQIAKSYGQVQEVAGDKDPEADLAQELANAIIGSGVLDFLTRKRQADEAEMERLKTLLETQTSQFTEELGALRQNLERSNRELAGARGELNRSTESVRTLSGQVQKLRLGVLSENTRHALLESNR